MTLLGNATSLANLTEQPRDISYSPDKGFESTRVWKGPATAVEALTAILRAQGYGYKVRNMPGGALAEVTATITGQADSNGSTPSPADITDTWELAPNSVLKDICECDCAAVAALDVTELKEIKAYMKNRPAPEDTPAWTDWDNQGPLVTLINAGVESWEVEQPILRHTYNVPRGVNPGFQWANIRKIFTTAQLIANEGVPPDYVFDLAAIGALFTNPTRTDGVALVYGWRKKMPHQSIGANGRREVNIEYHFGLWPTLLYSTV